MQTDVLGIPPMVYNFTGTTDLTKIDGLQFTTFGDLAGSGQLINVLNQGFYTTSSSTNLATFSNGLLIYPDYLFANNSVSNAVSSNVSLASRNLTTTGAIVTNLPNWTLIITIGLVVIILLGLGGYLAFKKKKIKVV